MDSIMHWLVKVIEAVGVGVIVAGAVIATIAFLKRLARKEGFTDTYNWYRASLGRRYFLD